MSLLQRRCQTISRNKWSTEQGSIKCLLLDIFTSYFGYQPRSYTQHLKECKLFNINHMCRKHQLRGWILPWICSGILDLSNLPHRTLEELKVSAQPSPFGPRLDMSGMRKGITHWAELSRGHPEEKTVWDFLGAVWGPPSRPHVGCVRMAALVSLCHALWEEERKHFFLFDATDFPVWAWGGAASVVLLLKILHMINGNKGRGWAQPCHFRDCFYHQSDTAWRFINIFNY